MYRNKFQIGIRQKYPNDPNASLYEKYKRSICIAARGEWKEGDPDPSFADFVKYLGKTNAEEFNEHFQLISSLCRS